MCNNSGGKCQKCDSSRCEAFIVCTYVLKNCRIISVRLMTVSSNFSLQSSVFFAVNICVRYKSIPFYSAY